MVTFAVAQIALFATGWLGPWRDAPAHKNNGRLALPFRLLLSFSLVVAAFLVWQVGPNRVAVYSQWVTFGMIVSFVGDLVMAKIIPFPNRLIGGMIAFAIAHGLYITAYNQTMQTISALEPYSRFGGALGLGLVVYGLAAALAWWFLIRNTQKGKILNFGALVYGLWIGVMASFALALGYALGFWLTAVGGVLFMASDSIIGMVNIRGTSIKNANDWIWLTYVAGQMGIIYAGLL